MICSDDFKILCDFITSHSSFNIQCQCTCGETYKILKSLGNSRPLVAQLHEKKACLSVVPCMTKAYDHDAMNTEASSNQSAILFYVIIFIND